MTIPLLALLQSTGATRLNILVKFDKGPSAERKVTGSNPGRINTQTLKIAEENVRLLCWHLQMIMSSLKRNQNRHPLFTARSLFGFFFFFVGLWSALVFVESERSKFFVGVRDSETSKINQVLSIAKCRVGCLWYWTFSGIYSFFWLFRSYRLKIARKNKQGLIPLGSQNDVKRLYRIKT